MRLLRPAPLLLLAVASYAAVVAGSLAGNLTALVIGLLATSGIEELLAASPDERPRDGLQRIELGPGWRAFSRDMFVVVFMLRSDALSGAAQVGLVAAVFARHVLLASYHVARLVITRRRLPRVVMRNFGPDIHTVAAPPSLVMERGARLTGSGGVLVGLALLWALVSGRYGLVLPAAIAAAVLAAVVAAPLVPGAAALLLGPRDAQLMRWAQQAVGTLNPEVILYFSGGADSVYQVNMWLETMERLDRRVLVLLRERRYLEELAPTRVPVLCLPFSVDLMNFALGGARVALYVANVGKNIHLLRDPRLKSAFIGHGDSDKTASFNPFTKVYDEVWVAGEAGRQRYLRAHVGVRDEQIVLVGRPQLDAVQPVVPRPPGAPFTVLYAPTWEGWTDDPNQSSLIPMGEQIVRTLLSTPGVRVLYRPHPLTGTVQPRGTQVHQTIVRMLAAAGPQHVAVPPGVALYDNFNESDALISDISSVVSDYLRSDKPYFVTNGAGDPDQEFRTRNPSAGAAYLVGPDGAGLAEGLASARGDDPMRARRREVRTYLLGDPDSDPMDLFRCAVDRLVAQADARAELVKAGEAPAESETDEPLQALPAE